MQQCPRCGYAVRDEVKFCPSCGAGVSGGWTGKLSAGDVLCERYTIVRPLARGGMGAVYVATDGRLGDAPVAIKEMTPHHRPGDTAAWDQAVDEFRREAALLAHLSHPNLPHVRDQFATTHVEFLVMELVPGHTLRAELAQRTQPVPLDEALNWFHQLSSVLDYLHQQLPQIIYRDLKPTNIMLRPDGRIVLIDFGIARLYKPEKKNDTVIYGTPGYAPPEQYGLGQTDVRTDIYALAMVMHEVLTGFQPSTRAEARPPKASGLREDVPQHISDALHQALDPDPDDRFATISEFVAAMDQSPLPEAQALLQQTAEEIAHSENSASTLLQSRKPVAFLAGILAIVALVLAVVLWWPQPVGEQQPTTTALGQPTVEAAATASSTEQSTPEPTQSTSENPVIQQLPPIPPGMVIVPDGEFILGSNNDEADEQPAGPAYLPTFFIDRTEVSNAAYAQCVAAGVCNEPVEPGSATRPEYWNNPTYADYPVVWVSWEQAQTYCQWQNKRLPTEAEWEKAARGNEGLRWPWGNTWDASKAQIDLSSQDSVAINTLSAGASPYGVLHMSGNVSEWTSSLDQPYPYSPTDGRELSNQSGSRIVRGISNTDDPEATRASNRERRLPLLADATLGFRCATEKPHEIAGMSYIPGGSWSIGSTDQQRQQWQATYGWSSLLNETPPSPITTTGFFLDLYEVTNSEYAQFISATNNPVPRNPFDPENLSVWNTDGSFPQEFANHPVVNLTWGDARAYCDWAGKRLPTEAEWERAAKGDATHTWPWGEEWDSSFANTAENRQESTTPVGSYPDHRGPYGTYDLAGNVWEWTSTLYRPYPYNATDGRESAAAAGARSLRGGSWLDDNKAAHVTGRNSLQPELTNVNVGFRCAQSIED